MKKFIAIIIILLLIVLGVSPILVGQVAQNQFNKLKANIAKKGIEAETTYDRNWFSSKATSEISLLDILKGQLNPLTQITDVGSSLTGIVVHTDHIIKHGPLVSSMPFMPIIATLQNNTSITGIKKSDGMPVDFSSVTTIKLNGNFDTQLKIPAANHIIDDIFSIKYDTIGCNLNVPASLDHYYADVDIPSIEFSKKDELVTIKKFAAQSDLKFIESIGLGQAKGKLESITITDSGENFTINNLSYKSLSKKEDKNLVANSTLEIKAIKINDKDYGKSKLDVAIKNLDFDAFVNFNKKLKDIQSKYARGNQEAINPMFIYSTLATEIPSLLKNSPIFEIKELSFNLPEGPVKADLMIQIAPMESFNFMDIVGLLNSITIKLNTSLPVAFIDKLQNDPAMSSNPQLAMVLSVLKKEGQSYKLNAIMDKGTLTVNNEIIPLPM